LFYVGYGETTVDAIALAYYRYERIVQDVAGYCEQSFLTDEDNPDRARGLGFLKRQFGAGAVIEVVFASDGESD